ncbi:MAG: siroheme synthase CysG [Alphaproteobacteria bacterium]|nr:siroheme synthase CysG [Alphaproteobacteria bacterium]
MKVFPQSWPLEGRTVMIVGDGVLAARKAALFEGAPATLRRVTAGRPSAEDLAAAAFVIVAVEDAAEAEACAALAKAAGRPVNVVDRPDLSDFHVPAIVDRGEIVISIASGGVAPTLARDVRAAIEAAVPASIAALGELARRIRDTVRARWPEVGPRRAAWERILRGRAGARAQAGDLDGAVETALVDLAAPAPAGLVHIVGAGPGDPELLTLKALRVLQDADLIVYDRLVDPRILGMARRDADRLYVGKARANHAVPQEEIGALLIEAARAGKRVVRLKGGDPFVFGRGGEELDALRAAGVDAFVVPGITAALGCAAAVGAPLTHRDHAQAVTFVTGHAREDARGADGDAEPDLDWRALASPNHTVVIYMGAARADALAARLIAAGRAPGTPALIVENGTRPDQTVTGTTLAELGAAVSRARPTGPALLIVGEVVGATVQALIAQAWRQAA